MKCVAILLLLAVAACAQPDVPADAQAALIMRVQQEEMMARKYMETMLKLQRSQYNMQAGQQFVQNLMMTYQKDGSDSDFSDSDDSATKQTTNDLVGSYSLLYATKIKFLQIIQHAEETQREFWMDRAIQLQVQSLGNQLPPQLLQLLYMKIYRTQLSTMKLSLSLQTVSHFVMWLEDAIEADSALLNGGEANVDELISDKLYAFTAYNNLAMIELQIFYIDMFLEQAGAQAAAGAVAGAQAAPAAADAAAGATAGAAASFLETEATAEPSSFFANPLFAFGGANSAGFMKYYKFMYLLFQQQAAHSALTSVQAENLANKNLNDNDESNDEDAMKYKKFAQQMFGSFGSYLTQASQIEYITAIFDLYSLYTPIVGAAPAAAPQGNASA